MFLLTVDPLTDCPLKPLSEDTGVRRPPYLWNGIPPSRPPELLSPSKSGLESLTFIAGIKSEDILTFCLFVTYLFLETVTFTKSYKRNSRKTYTVHYPNS